MHVDSNGKFRTCLQADDLVKKNQIIQYVESNMLRKYSRCYVIGPAYSFEKRFDSDDALRR